MNKTIYSSMPDIEVTYNQQNIETVSGLCNWFDKDTGGNSWFPKESDPEKLVENSNSIPCALSCFFHAFNILMFLLITYMKLI